MTYLQRRDHVDRRKIAAWHTLWELGQARAALRRMGEDLQEPPARSREAYADLIYRLGDEGPSHLRVLDGGRQEVAAVGRRPPLEASSQAAVGRQTPAVVDEQRQGQSTNLTADAGQGSPVRAPRRFERGHLPAPTNFNDGGEPA